MAISTIGTNAITDGTVSTADIQDGAITTSKFSSNVAIPGTTSTINGYTPTASNMYGKNILINGDMRIWQKGTDLNPASVGNGVTTVDRWTTQYCDFSPRIRKVEDTLTSGETVDTAEITKLSGTYASCEFSQKVETTTAKYLRGQTVTFSFWIKKVGSTFGSHNYDCWIGDSETVDDTVWTNTRTVDRSRATRPTGMSGSVNFTDNNWKKITITRTLSSDTNTIYCTIYTQSTPVNEGIRITKCQLELGSVATDFERRPIAHEFAMCQRYFIATQTISFFYFAGAGQSHAPINFVPMRAVPAVVYYPTVSDMYAKTNAGYCTQDGTGIVTVSQVNSGIDMDSAFKSQQGANMRVARTLNAEF